MSTHAEHTSAAQSAAAADDLHDQAAAVMPNGAEVLQTLAQKDPARTAEHAEQDLPAQAAKPADADEAGKRPLTASPDAQQSASAKGPDTDSAQMQSPAAAEDSGQGSALSMQAAPVTVLRSNPRFANKPAKMMANMAAASSDLPTSACGPGGFFPVSVCTSARLA